MLYLISEHFPKNSRYANEINLVWRSHSTLPYNCTFYHLVSSEVSSDCNGNFHHLLEIHCNWHFYRRTDLVSRIRTLLFSSGLALLLGVAHLKPCLIPVSLLRWIRIFLPRSGVTALKSWMGRWSWTPLLCLCGVWGVLPVFRRHGDHLALCAANLQVVDRRDEARLLRYLFVDLLFP